MEHKCLQYEQLNFIEQDPILVPHQFSKKEDIEISAFLISIIAWGQRKSILKSGERLIEILDHAPHDFILHHTESDLKRVMGFVHRTFNADDLQFFLNRLQALYREYRSLENCFLLNGAFEAKHSISRFKAIFFDATHLKRTEKHLADPLKKSSAKRLNMFLRWMVRSNKRGVDFGIWERIKPSDLMLPLDVHTGNVSRQLGLLKRKQNDWQAVEEITNVLRRLDPEDPVKYDFALFGMGESGEL